MRLSSLTERSSWIQFFPLSWMLRICFSFTLFWPCWNFSLGQAKTVQFQQRSPLPSWTFGYVENEKTLLTDQSFKGKTTVLFLWATWCQFCKARIPDLVAAQKEFSPDKIQIYFLNVDETKEAALKFVKANPGFVPNSLFDEGLKFKALAQVRAIPYTLLLDTKGVIRFIQEGDRANEISILKRKMNKLLKELP